MTANLATASIKPAGATVTRSLANLFGDLVFNVKTFGALGDNNNDDTVPIQNAINAAMAAGGGIVYIPPVQYPNCYLINAPLTFTNGLSQPASRLVTLMGQKGLDLHGSIIRGNFAGYLIDNPDIGAPTNLGAVIGLLLENNHASGRCIRFCSQTTGEIAECGIQAGLNGLFLEGNSYNILVRDCNIIGTAQTGTGIFSTQSIIQSCSLVGWDVAIQGSNVGLQITGNRFEVNNTAIVLGRDSTGATSQVIGALVAGNSGEQNNISVDIIAAASVVLAGNAWSGTVDPGGVNPPDYGIRIATLNGGLISGIISVTASIAGVDLSSVSGQNIVFVGMDVAAPAGGGVAWNMPTGGTPIVSFVNCNNPTAAMLVANLPAGAAAIEGMEFDVTDAQKTGSVPLSGSDLGATVIGGSTQHAKVRYNGSNWTCAGL